MPCLQFQQRQLSDCTSLASFVSRASGFFVFLFSVFIIQRSISWTPVNKIPCKYNFEREENYHHSINT